MKWLQRLFRTESRRNLGDPDVEWDWDRQQQPSLDPFDFATPPMDDEYLAGLARLTRKDPCEPGDRSGRE